MKYETPEFIVTEFDVVDIITTSGDVPPGGTGNEDELPFNPAAIDLDKRY